MNRQYHRYGGYDSGLLLLSSLQVASAIALWIYLSWNNYRIYNDDGVNLYLLSFASVQFAGTATAFSFALLERHNYFQYRRFAAAHYFAVLAALATVIVFSTFLLLFGSGYNHLHLDVTLCADKHANSSPEIYNQPDCAVLREKYAREDAIFLTATAIDLAWISAVTFYLKKTLAIIRT